MTPDPSPVPEALPQDTRTRLLESAILCFAAKGFDGAGIREIAKGAQANMALVAYHFQGKEGLYLEALREMFFRHPSPVSELPPLPPSGTPGAREAALRGMEDYIRAFMSELMTCPEEGALHEAAMTLLVREMQSPRPTSVPLLLDHLRPYVAYLMQCIQILRPDLEEDLQFAMGISILGQMLQLRNSLGVLRLMRGNPDYPEDLERLIQHYIGFSLRGLGVPEAFPPVRN